MACDNAVALKPGLVSIVIPTKNRHLSVERLLRSIAQQDYRPLEVIVVDDGSNPAVTLDRSEVLVLRNETSLGASGARNRGAASARGEYLIFFDDDAEAQDSSLIGRAVALAAADPTYGAIGFCQLGSDGAPNYMQPARSDCPCRTGVFFSYGALLRTAAFRKVGGFEPAVRFMFEEQELSLRLIDAGYSLIYDPTLRVFHHHDQNERSNLRSFRGSLRGQVVTAMLRYPALSIAPAFATAWWRHLRWTQHFMGRADYPGLWWSAREAAASLGYVRHHRKPVRMASLRLRRRLNAHPETLS
jgi:GT2 family glycosyltransferase